MPTEEQQREIFDRLEYKPSQEQWAIHRCPSRGRLVAGGERSGKSYSSSMDYMGRFWETPLLWLVAADYQRTKAEYNYICEAFDALGVDFDATKSVDPGEINVSGDFRITTVSAKDPRRLAMEAPDMIICCEASQVDYETYLRMFGRISEKRGNLLMSGTFESSLGWYVEAFQRGQAPNDEDLLSFSLPTWSNLAIYPGGRTDPEIKRLEAAGSKEWFMERFGGVPSPPKGVVFNEFRNHLHTGIAGDYEFDPTQQTYLCVDPGYQSAYSVLAAQKRGEHLWLVDEIYERGFVTSDIIKVCKQKPWWNSVVGGAIDIAGTQHQAMPAPAEVWLQESGVVLRSQKVKIQDGIERVKSFLTINPVTNQPLIHINSRCKGLISEMGGCPNPLDGQTRMYQWRMTSDGAVAGDTPDDKNNHSSKALAYGLVDLFGYTTASRRAKTKYF